MIKTVICFAFVVLGVMCLMPFGLLAAFFSLLGLRKPMSVFIYRLVQGWARCLIVLVGCKMTVLGKENIPRRGGICFVSNHASIADILMLLGHAGRPFGFVAKKELMAIPLLNVWISVLGGLFIDRKNPRKALKTINAGVKRIKAGGGMIIFPEGSRSRGKGLLPFRPGAFKLAAQSEAVIVPVAIAGTYDVFERNYRVNPCPVRITFCDPIKVADMPVEDRKMVLADRVREVIGKALEAGGGS
ncbi:MAG: 1-acyl-sn-glycerol-3-phosphate acyltransferase [Treponema sp.]|nr:1-acyl-sn-glycerol-3-phosphate acyltransferase [Treponema sp.]